MKFRLVKRSIADSETDHIEALGEMGMAHKLIAKEVYGSSRDSHLWRVQHILATAGTRVTDYRNGLNAHGKAVIAAIARETDLLATIQRTARATMASVSKRKIA